MNGKLWDKAETGSNFTPDQSGGLRAAGPVPQPLVLSVWEGRAGFGGKCCVCIEAPVSLPQICSRAALTCSFEERSFAVRVSFAGAPGGLGGQGPQKTSFGCTTASSD